MGAASPRHLILDAGALVGLERGDEKVRALLDLASRRRFTFVIPVGALAQVWRDGSRQARLSRFLRAPSVEFEPLLPESARACGALCGRAGTADIVDASVVVAALRRKAAIVTGDLDDLRRLDGSVLLIPL